MKKSLIDVLFMSEKRKGVLLLLKDGAKEMEYLLKSLDTTRPALLPQIKILKDYHLISHDEGTYQLTTIGKLVVNKIVPVLQSVEVFDTDIEYWGTHNLDFIPPPLLQSTDVLGKCKVIAPSLAEMYDAHQQYHESCMKSRSIFAVTTFLYPDFYDRFTRFTENNTTCTIVVSKELYTKLKRGKYSDFAKLISSNLLHFFIYPSKMDFLSFGYNDYDLVISPLRDDGEFDNKYLLFSNPSALEWGKELGEYYLKRSTPITEI